MLDRLRRRGSEESGVVLVLVAGLLVAILGMAAIAIDIGSFYKAQRQAQTAADAGALAASQDLPNSMSVATSDATTYATTNYPGSTVNVVTNYNNVANNIKVTVSASTPSFFGQIFGFTHADVSASAVAGGGGGAAPAAIFGYDTNCSHPGIALNANATDITGGVISNGSLSQQANPSSVLGSATYSGPNTCSYTDNGKGSFTSGPTVDPNPTSFPTDYRTQYPTTQYALSGGGSNSTVNFPSECTSVYSTLSWSQNNYSIPSGVYCANEIDLTGNYLSGTNVTFIANTFVITGQNMTLSAPNDTKLLFWDTGASTFDIQSNSMIVGSTDGTTGGTIFAPSATVQIDGNTAGTGFIEANDVVINGNSFQINGWGPVVGGTQSSLLQ